MSEIIRDAIDIIKRIWNLIKKIFVKLFKFIENIVGYFKNPHRLKILRENQNVVAVAMKEQLANNEYHVITCLFDKETNTILEKDYNNNALGIETEGLDNQTKTAFKESDVLILK